MNESKYEHFKNSLICLAIDYLIYLLNTNSRCPVRTLTQRYDNWHVRQTHGHECKRVTGTTRCSFADFCSNLRYQTKSNDISFDIVVIKNLWPVITLCKIVFFSTACYTSACYIFTVVVTPLVLGSQWSAACQTIVENVSNASGWRTLSFVCVIVNISTACKRDEPRSN